jgi:DNA-binding response OmpR family regulator
VAEISTSDNSRKFRVVVIEDDATVFTGLRLLLRHYNYNVDVFETLTAARATIQRDGADFVCLDLVMPDGSGVDLLQWLRMTRPNLPVCICTATEDPAILRRVRNLMPTLLQTKPIDFMRLLEAIKHASDAFAAAPTKQKVRAMMW